MKNFKIFFISLLLIATSSIFATVEKDSESAPSYDVTITGVEAFYLDDFNLENNLVPDTGYELYGNATWTLYIDDTQEIYYQYTVYYYQGIPQSYYRIFWDAPDDNTQNQEISHIKATCTVQLKKISTGVISSASVHDKNITNLGSNGMP